MFAVNCFLRLFGVVLVKDGDTERLLDDANARRAAAAILVEALKVADRTAADTDRVRMFREIIAAHDVYHDRPRVFIEVMKGSYINAGH